MPVFIYDQADAFFAGLDFSWKEDWSKQFSGVFRASYLWSKNVSKNQPLINQPPLTTNYSLVWNQKKFWKFTSSKLSVIPSYTFKQYNAPRTVSPQDLIDGTEIITSESEIFDFKDAPNGYFLLDIAWALSWKNLSGSIGIKNILNTRYRMYLNEMRYFSGGLGRNVSFTLNYLFKSKKNEKNDHD